MQTTSLYHPSRYYTSFCSIPEQKYLQKVHYFEKHETKINQIDISERYLITKYYLEALFRIKAYHKFIVYSDIILSLSLNIDLEDTLNYFHKVLRQKALANFAIGKYEKAAKLCRQIIKMDSDPKINRIFVKSTKRILRQNQQGRKALLIILLSAALIVYFLNIIFFIPFYPEIATFITKGKYVILIFSFFIVAVTEIAISRKANEELAEILSLSADFVDND